MEYDPFEYITLRRYHGETYEQWMKGLITDAIEFPRSRDRSRFENSLAQILNQCEYVKMPDYDLKLNSTITATNIKAGNSKISIDPIYLECDILEVIPPRTESIKCKRIKDFSVFTKPYYKHLYVTKHPHKCDPGFEYFLKNVTIGTSNLNYSNVQKVHYSLYDFPLSDSDDDVPLSDPKDDVPLSDLNDISSSLSDLDVDNLPIGAVYANNWEKIPVHPFLFPTCKILFDNLSPEILTHKVFVIQQKISDEHLSIMDYLISSPTILIKHHITNQWIRYPNPGFTFICKYPNYLTE